MHHVRPRLPHIRQPSPLRGRRTQCRLLFVNATQIFPSRIALAHPVKTTKVLTTVDMTGERPEIFPRPSLLSRARSAYSNPEVPQQPLLGLALDRRDDLDVLGE